MEDKVINEDWQAFLRMLPANWRELARETKALTRKPKNFKNEETMLRLFFLHLANGYSLRETITRAKIANIADVTDVALLKRLRSSENWLKTLCICLLREKGVILESSVEKQSISLRLVDGTIVKEPGQTGSRWRLHYSLSLPDLHCDYFKLTEAKGLDTGESFKQFPVKKGDCIVGDRGYSTAQGISYVKNKGGYSLVRVNTAAFDFYTDNESFNLLEAVSHLKIAFQSGEWKVKLKTDDELIDARLCVMRKNAASEEAEIKKILKEAAKKKRQVKPETLEYAKYIIILTTLPADKFNSRLVLEWYRLRWQIELAIKRLKSLINLGHLPKYDERSSRAWLYGKILVGLMVEKMMSYAGSFSPYGYYL